MSVYVGYTQRFSGDFLHIDIFKKLQTEREKDHAFVASTSIPHDIHNILSSNKSFNSHVECLRKRFFVIKALSQTSRN